MTELKNKTDRRSFCKSMAATGTALLALGPSALLAFSTDEKAEELTYGMGVQINKCIGCGRCVNACKIENKVSEAPFFFRTWVERYHVMRDGEVDVESPLGGREGFGDKRLDDSALRSFFVPKLCNHCTNAPCVQVCPVGATYTTKDGVVLVDKEYCVGCRYCIQACPYGARYLDPVTHTADKCTFCYHRLKKGLKPACVEVCPTEARIFGVLNQRSSPLTRFMRFNEIQVLKPHLNTEPKVYYSHLDGTVI